MTGIKTATVGGCAGALGMALTECLLESGSKVVGFCRGDDAEKMKGRHEAAGDRFTLAAGDLTDAGDCQRLVRSAAETLGGIDAHFHTAGAFSWVRWQDAEESQIESLFHSNYTTARVLGVAVFRAMVANGGGSMMFVSARDSQRAAGLGFGPYMAGKAALNMLVTSLAAEGGADGIRVNAVAPTVIDTAVNRQDMPDQDPSQWVNPDRLARLMIELSAAQHADLTGAIIPITGGMF